MILLHVGRPVWESHGVRTVSLLAYIHARDVERDTLSYQTKNVKTPYEYIQQSRLRFKSEPFAEKYTTLFLKSSTGLTTYQYKTCSCL